MAQKVTNYIVDACALIAYLREEKGNTGVLRFSWLR